MPTEKAWIHEEKYSGESTKSKMSRVAEKMDKETNTLIVTALDDIAWVLNLRGNDIDYNPLFFSYLLLHKDGESQKCDLFINKDKVSDE
jgi:Xaa-Pro aminopeptidase